MNKTFIGVIVVVVAGLVAWGVMENLNANEALERARNAEARSEVYLSERDAALAQAQTDSLRAAETLVTLDSVTAAGEAERDSLASEVQEEMAHHASLADSARAMVDSATAAVITRMELQAQAALAREREISQSMGVENNQLRVTVSTLMAETMSLRGVIRADSLVISEQQVAIDGYRRVADPPFIQKVVGALPEIGLGAGVIVLLLAANVIN